MDLHPDQEHVHEGEPQGHTTVAVRLLGAVTVPGHESMAPWVRRWVRLLAGPGHPDAEDIELCASELFSNALLHSVSGEKHGMVSVTVSQSGKLICVSVTDEGTSKPRGTEVINGYGLQLVAALAHRHGTTRDTDGTTTAWFQFHAAKESMSRSLTGR